jgi:hypothetical protein
LTSCHDENAVTPNEIAAVANVIFERNDSSLISIKITFPNGRKNDDEIISSITFSPSFPFKSIWKLDTLVLTPTTTLEELSKYELCLGDDKFVKKEKLQFLTGPYPYQTNEVSINLNYWLLNPSYQFTSDSLILTYYSYAGWQPNAVISAQFALLCYKDYIKNKNESSKNLFFRQVRFFCSNYTLIDGAIAYPYPFPFRDLSAGWYSGMAQGQVVSVLIRAYVLTNDNKYLDIARKVVDFMFVPVNRGGVFTYTPEGYEWIEEYPTTPSSYVWNGFVFAVMGLIDYNKVCPSPEITEHIRQCIISIKQTIDLYDTGSQLYYERLNRHFCDVRYIGNQVYQCRHLYFATKDEFFNDLYEKWLTYLDSDAFFALYD